MVGNRFRLKDGTVVTVKSVSGGNFLSLTAEGNPRYFNSGDICHKLGNPCDSLDCFDKKSSSKAQNTPSKPSKEGEDTQDKE